MMKRDLTEDDRLVYLATNSVLGGMIASLLGSVFAIGLAVAVFYWSH